LRITNIGDEKLTAKDQLSILKYIVLDLSYLFIFFLNTFLIDSFLYIGKANRSFGGMDRGA